MTTPPPEVTTLITAADGWVRETINASNKKSRAHEIITHYGKKKARLTNPGAMLVFRILADHVSCQSVTGTSVGVTVSMSRLVDESLQGASTVRRHLRDMAENGELWFDEECKGGRGVTNTYYFLLPNRDAEDRGKRTTKGARPNPKKGTTVVKADETPEPIVVPGVQVTELPAPRHDEALFTPQQPEPEQTPANVTKIDKKRKSDLPEPVEAAAREAQIAYYEAYKAANGGVSPVIQMDVVLRNLRSLAKMMLGQPIPAGFSSRRDAMVEFCTWAGRNKKNSKTFTGDYEFWANNPATRGRVGGPITTARAAAAESTRVHNFG